MTYISSETNRHEFDEEHEWVKILAQRSKIHGMLLIFVQKLCTAFHEYGPAAEAGAVYSEKWPFIRERLIKRTEKVIEVADDNSLGGLKGIAELKEIIQQLKKNAVMPDLMELAEEVHQINHHICDELLDHKTQ